MKTKRIIGEYHGKEQGPMVFITAGVHGNEPSGVLALQRVIAELEESGPTMKGSLIGIAGNMAALNKDIRFIDEDLNRTWTKEKLAAIENLTQEEKEMNDTLKVIRANSTKNPKRYFLDCHSTSSESSPYISARCGRK